VRLLRQHLHVAVMSRGFGRNSTGFLLVRPEHQSRSAGDEPLMYVRKYRDVAVAVSESRSVGIPQLLQVRPEIQVVLLDDAFQHRSVSPYVNILLTEYDHPFYSDWLLPSGSLREWRTGYRRADVIIVTKCPSALSPDERDRILKRLHLRSHQSVFFTAYQYHRPYSMYAQTGRLELSEQSSVLLVCGIARTRYLIEYVSKITGHLEVLEFADHHAYQPADLDIIERRFQNLPGQNKCILTTEKDAVRLEAFGSFILTKNLPVYLLALEVIFLFNGGSRFDTMIRQYLLDFKA
jgi:tetraacyldisaccharide 4'-kinase